MEVRYIEIKTSPEGQTIKAYTPAQYKKEMTRRKNAAARARKLTRLQERVGAVLAMLGFLMDLILVIVGVSLLVFTIVMIQLFKVYGTVPDTLITCVFATLGGECGIMGWIKTTKDRNRERKWEQEDKQEAKAEAAEVPPGDMPGA